MILYTTTTIAGMQAGISTDAVRMMETERAIPAARARSIYRVISEEKALAEDEDL